MQDFLASSEDMTKFIATVSDAADQAREANNGTKDIALSFDEWGVWYSDKWNEQEDQWKAEAAQGLHHEPWPKSPHLLEDIYTAADAVVEGSLMITLLKHCDRVRSASRAQLVNVIAPIMAEEQARHGGRHVLPVRRSRPSRARPGLRSGHQLPHHPYRAYGDVAGHRRGSHVG